MRLMSRRRYSMKRGEDQRDQAHRHHQRARRERRRVGRQQQLEAQEREQRDVEQQPGEHRRDRRRALGMGVRQPGVQRRQADLGAVAEQQEHEGEVEQRRDRSAARPVTSTRPGHGVQALADHRPRRKIDEDGAEQRERDADAAQDEILPRRLERLRACDRCRPSARWSASPARSPPTSARCCSPPAPGSSRTSAVWYIA